LNDSISSQQSIQLIQELKARFDDENQKKQIALLTQEKQIAELAATRQRYIIGVSIAGALLLFLLAALIYRSLRASRRSRLKLQEAFVTIQEKNKSITDSIRYARHLQDAILPEEETIQRLLPNSFWFYKPKDIVAGDFYWIQKLNDLIFFAVADCTGHGVPGAMVSVVCSKALNTALLEMHITEPGAILDAATDIVVSTFARTKSELSDGMDISLCVWDTKTRTLQWAGANNPLLIVFAAEAQLVKADKQPVGKSLKRNTFTTHTFQFEQPVQLYLFTDGFADQFGGPDGKKFKQKQLTEMLTALAELPAGEQQRKLGETLTDWQGTLEQIDDVLVAGIKL
ncbi:MAG: PP2C family protein-serine/threonine phosphatase, partial [Bacteroidia bacterium]